MKIQMSIAWGKRYSQIYIRWSQKWPSLFTAQGKRGRENKQTKKKTFKLHPNQPRCLELTNSQGQPGAHLKGWDQGPSNRATLCCVLATRLSLWQAGLHPRLSCHLGLTLSLGFSVVRVLGRALLLVPFSSGVSCGASRQGEPERDRAGGGTARKTFKKQKFQYLIIFKDPPI